MPLSAVLSQVALRAELQRLRAAPQAWSQERVSVVVTVAPLLWHPPVHVPARHRMKVRHGRWWRAAPIQQARVRVFIC